MVIVCGHSFPNPVAAAWRLLLAAPVSGGIPQPRGFISTRCFCFCLSHSNQFGPKGEAVSVRGSDRGTFRVHGLEGNLYTHTHTRARINTWRMKKQAHQREKETDREGKKNGFMYSMLGSAFINYEMFDVDCTV